MISSKMKAMVSNSSVIRKMFEEGKRLSQIYGEENVFDFSIGNPSVEPPEKIKEIMQKIINEEKPNILHGYMNNSGYEDVRDAIANNLSNKYNFKVKKLQFIYAGYKKEAIMVLIKATKNGKMGSLKVMPPVDVLEHKSYKGIFEKGE